MKLTEHFEKKKLSLSFEVFPPKTDSSFETVQHATEAMALLHPAFMSVTYGAGGGTSKYTLEIARHIEQEYGITTVAHLTCVSSTKETVLARIQELKEAGIDCYAWTVDTIENADYMYQFENHEVAIITNKPQLFFDYR